MTNAPLILISPSTRRLGAEVADVSISLSNRYARAIIDAGGIPLVFPCAGSKELVAEAIRRADGVLLTGGDDVQPKLYSPEVPPELAEKMGAVEPERDALELIIVDEVFRQQKSLLAICRGHQLLNVALGGDLIVDIPTQIPSAMNHQRPDMKHDPVHELALTPDSLLAKIAGQRTLGVNSTHHQAIGRVAKLLRVTARSADDIVEGLELKKPGMLPFLLAVQFHPELLADRYKEFLRLFENFVCSCAASRMKKL